MIDIASGEVGDCEPRTEVRPFTNKQLELATIFADQAVIAIENVRLFDEVQARTRELTESLEYRMATSEVLNVISRSPSELQPVFDSIVATAAGLCQADYAMIHRFEHGRFRLVAANKVEADYVKWLAQNPELVGMHSYGDARTWITTPLIQNDPQYSELLALSLQRRGRGRNLQIDAQHIFVAAKQACDVFLTCDNRILQRAAAIRKIFPLVVQKPSDFVASQGW